MSHPNIQMQQIGVRCDRISSGLEIDNKKIKNNLIIDTSKERRELLHLMTKIKSRECRSINNVKSVLCNKLMKKEKKTLSVPVTKQ